jgi:predicted phage terminase large subunit-like protein
MAKPLSLDKLISDPAARDNLTDSQLLDFFNQLKRAAAGFGKVTLDLSPAAFAEKYSNKVWKPAKHLAYLSAKLEQLEKRKIKRLLVSMPPRHGKSFLIDWFFPAWWLVRHPSDRVILAGYGETFARTWGARVRDTILENADDFNLLVNKERTAADDWELTSKGGMLCVGVGGALMGRGANLLIIDDPIKSEEEANSETYREKMWDWWQTTAYTRLEPDGVVVGVMTRWHTDDLFARIIANDESKEWTVINIPAEALENDELGRAPGEWLWPDRFPASEYEERKRTLNPWWWAALYQQSPTPEGGGLLKRDWWRFYHTPPEDFDQMIQSWDLSLKDKETSDYCVGQLWGRKGSNCYLLDQVRGKFDLKQVCDHMIRWTLKYPKAIAKLVEDTAMGPALKNTLQNKVQGIIPIPVKNTSKRSRVENAVPILQGGNCYVPERESGEKDKWVMDFIEELTNFPKGANDDQVDAFTQAMAYLQPAAWRQLKREEREKDNSAILTPLEARAIVVNEKHKKAIKDIEKRYQIIQGPRRRTLW